ncbi:MAG: NAD(P)/FAD-dependent oxidoreductase [Sphingobium sp.]
MNARAGMYDVVIVGAGMAGASLGAELAGHGSVLLVEMEDQPGYHATGRSVAFWSESYGGPDIRPLTRASGPFLEHPPADFAAQGFLSARGGIHIGQAEDAGRREALVADHGDDGLFRRLEQGEMRARLPHLRESWTIGLEEASLRDIDVAALHGAYLSRLRGRGGGILSGCRYEGARRLGVAEGWEIRLSTGQTVRAGVLINAAGAWADDVARAAGVAPLGIRPLRRTVAQVRVDPPAPDAMPLILDLAQRFYFKPVGGGRIWLTPHDEHPSLAIDAAPEEVDIAIAIDRLQSAMDWRVEAVERRWAGLRSFAPDRRPVYGRDPDAPGFFWFAGQGGFGIQTAPAAARLACGLLVGGEADPMVRGIEARAYAPDRFRASALSNPPGAG